MCGIAGIFHLDGKPASVKLLKRMTDALSHRGPDGEGFWVDSFVGLGHRRLAILDLSPLGHQPMVSRNGNFVISYNGEVYNFENLRAELQALGHEFNSRTDTEVILQGFDQWGLELIPRLNGMFALAIYDRDEKRLVLARDRYGIKPLYYYQKDGLVLFASEIKALLTHPSVSVEVNLDSLNEYFSFQNVFSDFTLFKNIELLPPASIVTVQLGNSSNRQLKKYWDFKFDSSCRLESDQEYITVLNRLFEQAVNRQLVSDREIGTYLSGGIDSGAITCVAAQSIESLKSFTVGFDLSSASGLELGFDERGKAEFLSNRYKTLHYEVVLKSGDMERCMADLVWSLEDLRVGQCYPNYYVANLASRFVKVALSGIGGDEIFAGYPWRYYQASASTSLNDFTAQYFNYWQRLLTDDQKRSFFQPDVASALDFDSPKSVFSKIVNFPGQEITEPQDCINLSLYLETKTFLPGILLVEDKLSMAHGLETRVPFLDNDLVEFAMAVPPQFKLQGPFSALDENTSGPKRSRFFEQSHDGKLLLRRAMLKYVPEAYVTAPKQGFSGPDASWFKGESIEYVRSLLLNKRARIYDYLNYDEVVRLMGDHLNGRANRRLLIWSLLCFEWWNRVFNK